MNDNSKNVSLPVSAAMFKGKRVTTFGFNNSDLKLFTYSILFHENVLFLSKVMV
jgi:hypothetical protein